MRHFILLLGFLLAPFTLHAAGTCGAPSVCLVPGADFPYQGSCTGPAVNQVVDRNLATLACHGNGAQMLKPVYTDGSHKCFYIDNTGNNSAYVPMNSLSELGAFLDAVKARTIDGNHLSLRYGCEAARKVDACGQTVNLPDSPKGSVITSTKYNNVTTFTCTVTNAAAPENCGSWVVQTNGGDCDKPKPPTGGGGGGDTGGGGDGGGW